MCTVCGLKVRRTVVLFLCPKRYLSDWHFAAKGRKIEAAHPPPSSGCFLQIN